jgi:hypothetical protein
VHRAANVVGLVAATASPRSCLCHVSDKFAVPIAFSALVAMAGVLIQAIIGNIQGPTHSPGRPAPPPPCAIWLWSHRWLAIAIAAAPHPPGHYARHAQFTTRSSSHRVWVLVGSVLVHRRVYLNCGRHCEAQNTELQSWYSLSVIALPEPATMVLNYVNSDQGTGMARPVEVREPSVGTRPRYWSHRLSWHQ